MSNSNRILEGGAIDEAGEDTVIDLDRIKGEAADKLLNLTEGATLEVDLEKFLVHARDIIIKNTLHHEEDPAPGSPLQYKVTITSISRPQHTPLTGEQLTKFTGKQMEDEAEFRTFLEKRETENLETQATDMKKMVVRKALISANPFEIPEGFLFKWVNQQREKQIEAGSREARHLFRDAKWSLLLTRISERRWPGSHRKGHSAPGDQLDRPECQLYADGHQETHGSALCQ